MTVTGHMYAAPALSIATGESYMPSSLTPEHFANLDLFSRMAWLAMD